MNECVCGWVQEVYVQGQDKVYKDVIDPAVREWTSRLMCTFMSFQTNMQAAPLPSHQPNQMELALFHDPLLPQVA